MKIPDETLEKFKAHAEAGVNAFHKALGEAPTPDVFIRAFDTVLYPSLKQSYIDVARSEFERLGKEWVRSIVLETFDKFVEGK